MAFTTNGANDLLLYGFNSTALPAAWTATLYWSLHTADPGAAGSQTTNEISYTGYARQPGTRSGSAMFTASGAGWTNAAIITFPASSGGTGGTVTHVGLGCSSSSTGRLILRGAMVPTIPVSNGSGAILLPAGSISFSLSTTL